MRSCHGLWGLALVIHLFLLINSIHAQLKANQNPEYEYDDDDDYINSKDVGGRGASGPAVETPYEEMKCPSCPDVPCKKDDAMFDVRGKLTVPPSMGMMRVGCNKTFVFSSELAKPDVAEKICCKMGMRLLSIDSKEEMACIVNIFRDLYDGYNFFWTSGRISNDCPGKMGWCTTGREGNKDALWKKDAYAFSGECVVAKFYDDDKGKNGLDRAGCHIKNNFICETPNIKHTVKEAAKAVLKQGQVAQCTDPVCPQIKCEKDATMFDTIGRLELPAELGRVQVACGTTYVISNIRKNFVEAQEACCNLDMKLISIEARNESNCLEDYLDMNEQYWTSGSDLGCEGNYGWCSIGGKEFARNLPWQTLEPNNHGNNEHCINIDLIAWDSSKFVLNDNNCEKKMKFICEGSQGKAMALSPKVTTLAPPVVVTIPQCSQAACPSHDCKPSDPELQDDFTEVTFGQPKRVCGKTFYFSKNRTSFANAGKACHCALNLKPLSVETKQEMDCLAKVAQEEYKKKNATLWTSASDDMCPGKYTWCSTRNMMTSAAKWRVGEPSLRNWLQACVAVHIGNKEEEFNGLADYKCSRKFRFVCEGA